MTLFNFVKNFGRKVHSRFDKFINRKYYNIYNKRFNGLSDEELLYCVTHQFEATFGYTPDFDNPKTFNEKLNWEKLYYQNPLMTVCADKVKARDYYCSKIQNGEKHLVKQFSVYSSIDEIVLDDLPKTFVLKSNWGSGRQIIVKDKSKFDFNKEMLNLKSWFEKTSNHYYAHFEFGYKDIVPKIVCEEYLNFDYKLEFFCFNGQPKFFWIVLNDKTSAVKANFYDINWNKLDIINKYPNFNKVIIKPMCYDKLLDITKILSNDFPFVRCDFYIIGDDFKFSEMTFYHWAGLKKFKPEKYDLIFGNKLQLPQKQ